MPKIRKAKSQSFRTRRSPSERRSPSSFIPFQAALNLTSGSERKRSPSQRSPSSASQQDSKSPGSMSSKSPFSLSRQGTLRSNHSRKNSTTTHTLNLTTGRRSPQQLSPSGRRSPVFLMYDGNRSPLDLLIERKSPTTERNRSPTGQRSPLHLGPFGFVESDRRTSTVHVQDQKSPTAVLLGFDESRRSPTIQVQGRRSPIGFSHGLITNIPISSPQEKRSPSGMTTLNIPPITVSNPSDIYTITGKTVENYSQEDSITEIIVPLISSPARPSTTAQIQPRKEPRSVMRDLLAFVRKPSKKTTTRTGRFAAAFSRAETNSASPMMRQSTYSTSPAASSRAAKSAVTKQMSEISFEPKMSLKILNSKMSLRLRRTIEKVKDLKSSGDEISDAESSASKIDKQGNTSSDVPFEFDSIHFEKVGESYIKHDQIREETFEETTPSPQAQNVSITFKETKLRKFEEKTEIINGNILKGQANFQKDKLNSSETNDSVDSIKEDGVNLVDNQMDIKNMQTKIFTDERIVQLKSTLKELILKPEPIYANISETIKKNGWEEPQKENKSELTIQCPTFEIMPPSRRSSFDPPRSPYLENLRSPCETDAILNRLDSAGDSFEMVDTDRNRESSFESRYPSSSYTSFDISRYQSTSCEEQTSSFEIIDVDINKFDANDEKLKIDLRKSSIELVDSDTFQKSGCSNRKSSLETHFDFETPTRLATPKTKNKTHSMNYRVRSPLSSNYSSHDSHDCSYPPPSLPRGKYFQTNDCHSSEPSPRYDHQRRSIFESKMRQRNVSPYLSSHLTSSSEFEPPSPRRAASASPKHTFTFRIVLKKVDSSPDAICTTNERRRSKDRTDRLRRHDSRKKRFWETGKSF